MDPQQLLGALASACPPRTPREALVLACHAVCLLNGGSDLEPSSSWLELCHQGNEGGFPTQRLVVVLQHDKEKKQQESGAGQEEVEEDEICIKPWGVEGQGGGEPALLLYGRRRRLDAAAVHRLDLSVPAYIGDDDKVVGEGEGSVLSIPGSHTVLYSCRFRALAARLVTHFLSKLRPELFLAQQLPCFTYVMRADEERGEGRGGGGGLLVSSSSSSSSSLLFDELLPFLPVIAVGRLAQTARQYHHPLSDEGKQGERAWKTLLARDFPSSLRSSSTPTAPESSRTVYRRCQALARPPPRRCIYRPDDWDFPVWHPLGPSPHHPNYPPLVGEGWMGGGMVGGGVARPRYLPPIVLPPFLGGGGGGGGGGGWGGDDDGDDIQLWR